ncbi:hypothetical protein THAOC_26989, partial [Thalassiosira oceanica]
MIEVSAQSVTEWSIAFETSPRPEDHGTGPRTAREGARKACFHRKFDSSLRQRACCGRGEGEHGARLSRSTELPPGSVVARSRRRTHPTYNTAVAASPTAGGGRSKKCPLAFASSSDPTFGVPQGVGINLLGIAIGCVAFAANSGSKAVMAGPDLTPVVFFAQAGASVVA